MKAKGVIAVASVCAISIFGGLYYYKDINKIENIDNLICKNEDGNLSCATKDLKPYTGIILIKYPDTDQIDKKIHIKNGKPNGLSKSYSKNGQLKSEANYKDGKILSEYIYNGNMKVYKEYYENEKLALEANYKDLRLDRVYKFYREGGQLWREVSYKNGQKDGLAKDYYSNGQLQTEENYKDGMLNGLVKTYYEDGQLKSEANYKDGKILREYIYNGNMNVYKEYDENEKLVLEANYKDLGLDRVYKFYREGGQLWREVSYKDGQKDGLAKYYYKNGRVEANYKDGKILSEYIYNGNMKVYKEYYENEKLALEANYKDLRLDGVYKFYREDGQLWREASYKDGQKDGLAKDYYDNGQLQTEENYKDGMLNGLVKTYYEDGQLKSEFSYKDDKKYELAKLYYKNGQIEKEYIYNNGFLDGLQKFYYEDGQLKSEFSYKNGKRNGITKTYYYDGESEENYKDGKKDGLSISYYKNGQIEKEENYKDGKKDGLSISYYENGQIEKEENYKNDKLDGSQKIYSKNGQLEREDRYEYGIRDKSTIKDNKDLLSIDGCANCDIDGDSFVKIGSRVYFVLNKANKVELWGYFSRFSESWGEATSSLVYWDEKDNKIHYVCEATDDYLHYSNGVFYLEQYNKKKKVRTIFSVDKNGKNYKSYGKGKIVAFDKQNGILGIYNNEKIEMIKDREFVGSIDYKPSYYDIGNIKIIGDYVWYYYGYRTLYRVNWKDPKEKYTYEENICYSDGELDDYPGCTDLVNVIQDKDNAYVIFERREGSGNYSNFAAVYKIDLSKNIKEYLYNSEELSGLSSEYISPDIRFDNSGMIKINAPENLLTEDFKIKDKRLYISSNKQDILLEENDNIGADRLLDNHKSARNMDYESDIIVEREQKIANKVYAHITWVGRNPIWDVGWRRAFMDLKSWYIVKDLSTNKINIITSMTMDENLKNFEFISKIQEAITKNDKEDEVIEYPNDYHFHCLGDESEKYIYGIHALLEAAFIGNEELMEWVINNYADADVNSKDKEGNTALMIASLHNNKKAVELLLKNGANVNTVNNKGETALMIAIKNKNKEVIELLLKDAQTGGKDTVKNI